jgi:catechol 2,3-dioxygenase
MPPDQRQNDPFPTNSPVAIIKHTWRFSSSPWEIKKEMNEFQLPAETAIGRVHLRVSDLEQSLRFYHQLLGFRVSERRSRTAFLSSHADGRDQLQITQDRDAPMRPRGSTGLYHLAIRLPNRSGLGLLLQQLIDRRVRFGGFADHGVSEALYLTDPEGNGVELYSDRPRDDWVERDNQIVMVTEPLDLDSLLQEALRDPEPWQGLPAGTDIGHVHLQVSDLARAEAFYGGLLGLNVTQRSYPGALFMSAGGYHHHLGLNTWAGRGAPNPPNDSLGLISFSLDVPDCDAWQQVVERCRKAGVRIQSDAASSIVVYDSDGNGVEIRCWTSHDRRGRQ